MPGAPGRAAQLGISVPEAERCAAPKAERAASMISRVHGELVIEVPEERAQALQAGLTPLMEPPPLPSFRVFPCPHPRLGRAWNCAGERAVARWGGAIRAGKGLCRHTGYRDLGGAIEDFARQTAPVGA